MALDFFKKGFFKKNKKDENKALDNVKEDVYPEDKLQENLDETVKVMPKKSKDDIIKAIFNNLEISINSPLKLLWNIFYKNSSDIAFNPMEYAFEPLIQANAKINEINEGNSKEYIEYDDNQKNFAGFVNRIQSNSLKLIKELIQESVTGGIDDFIHNIDSYELESYLSICSNYKTIDEFKHACEEKRKASRKKAIDAQVFTQVSKDRIHAWIMAIPPINGGADLTEDIINTHLAESEIVAGINTSVINEICKNKKYFYIFEIATGEYVIHGKDGYVVDKFPRKNIINIREDENGNLNYKELNNVRSVHKDEIISEVYYPIEGKDGMRVDGKVISAIQGKEPKIPNGKNIAFNEDKSMLIAEKDGELLFKDGVFMINELLTIENDVDNASGNINFAGNVLIKGDVREGFSVKAEGNITVLGTAEGASLISAGDIILNHGMTGGGKGTIKASGNIKSKFLENCTAYARGIVEVDQVMYSEISGGESVVISGRKGSVTGGKIIAGKSITANIIGAANNSYLKTEVVLGCTPDMIKRQSNITNSLKEVSDKLFKISQDINYIEENIDHMNEERISKLEKLKIQQKFMRLQKENLERNLEELTEEMEETAKTCKFKCKTLNPIINFKIGDNTYTLNKQLEECTLFRKNDSVVLTSLSLAENIVF